MRWQIRISAFISWYFYLDLLNRNIVRAVKKTPKTWVYDITNNLHRAAVKVSRSLESIIWRILREQQYRGYSTKCKMQTIPKMAIPQNANHSSVVRIGRRDYSLQRSTEMRPKVLECFVTGETKINLYQSYGKAKWQQLYFPLLWLHFWLLAPVVI